MRIELQHVVNTRYSVLARFVTVVRCDEMAFHITSTTYLQTILVGSSRGSKA